MTHVVLQPATAALVKPAIANRFRLDWKTGALLIALFSLLRFALVLHATLTRNYQLVALIFVAMLALPFLVLTRAGRQAIGLRWPRHWWGLLLGAAVGIGSCTALFYLTTFCFGFGEGNSFAYIAKSYGNLPAVLNEQTRWVYFLIYSSMSMLFSPIGEELFYRGLVHACFSPRLGHSRATALDGAAFALVHLAHFGLVHTAQGWQLLPGPTLVWVLGLFSTCWLFSIARAKSGSVLGAMVAHSLFNLTMNYFIFYHIL
jgi:membrane protease YdiL (CAAX protease family)